MKEITVGTVAILLGVITFGNLNYKPNTLKAVSPAVKIKIKTLEEISDNLSLEEGIHPKFIRSIITVESSWKSNARSSAGALGLMQVMPANTRFCGIKPEELYDPTKNIRCGIKIIKDNLKRLNSRILAIRAYNASPKCLQGSCRNVEKYVSKVLGHFGKDLPILEENNV